jgi:hypothetical protein
MSNDLHRNFLDESHERAVLLAMSDATDDLLRRRKEGQPEQAKTVEARLEQIEKRLELLEVKR